MKKQIFYTKPCLKVLKAETGSLLAASGITGSGDNFGWGAKGSNFADDTAPARKTNRAAVQTYKKTKVAAIVHIFMAEHLCTTTL